MLIKRQRAKLAEKNRDVRLIILTLAMSIFGGLIIFRLFNLQIMDHAFYSALASDQHGLQQILAPQRGEIFVKDENTKDKLYPLAANQSLNLLYADPRLIDDPAGTAVKLAAVLSISDQESVDELIYKLSKKDDPYEPLKNKISDEEAREIEELNIDGLGFIKENWRRYPENNVASHILGFVGFDGDEKNGRYGLEGYFNELLTGRAGSLKMETDVQGRIIPVAEKELERAQDGSDLVLTIDRTLEFFVCDKLKQAVGDYQADKGTVIIMEPETGAILAMCSYPDFDPNKYSEADDTGVFNNPAIFDQYEPGSIFKPITMAAALDTEKVAPETTYEDKGYVQVGKFTIRNYDYKTYGRSDMIEVLENSINTGAIYAVQQLDEGVFRDYVRNFGFGELTGINLNKEVAGDVSSLDKNGKIYPITASFGQGVAVTPLQMVAAYAAIANQGKLFKPYIVDEIINGDGTRAKTESRMIRQVISPRTSHLLTGMLVMVVDNGHAKKAGVPGYFIAGKTGTAQVPDYEKGGYGDKTIHSFVGFGPVDQPKFAMITKLDNPKSVRDAASSAAPLFGQIADFLLEYYEIPPER